ncbi:MAG: calcium-translocating P-type ATPase, PMCA-type [Mycoplasmatota bacterium]
MQGLNEDEVLESIKKNGKNEINGKKSDSILTLFINSLSDPIIKILIIALFIRVIILFKNFDWFETIGILIAIFVASLISTLSEYGSNKAFEKILEESSNIKCKVIRNGIKKEIFVKDVVVDDLIYLQSGDKIPADGFLIDGQITVDEQIIDGETKEKYKYSTKKSKVYMGTTVYSKEGIMKVTNIGEKTFYGNIALGLNEKQPDSPLKLKLFKLAKVISKIGYVGAFFVFFSYMLSVIVINNNFDIVLIKESLSDINFLLDHLFKAITLCVTIIVVAVPEGLPMMITLVLSSNMKKMFKENVLVRKMTGIETAGSLNILFTDKTGTLTNGKLEVVKIVDINNVEVLLKKNTKYVNYLKESLVYNNDSFFTKEKILGGNSTDRAILKYVGNNEKKHLVINKEVFDSQKKYSSVTIDNGSKITYFKGAPEIILSKCDFYLDDFGNRKLLKNKNNILNYIKNYTKESYRVIATSFDNTFLGLILIKDEVRKEAIEGLQLVKKANIQTVMITGDNKETAYAIASELGMLDESSIVIDSKQLNDMSDDKIKQILPNLKVVARSFPQDKSRLVKLAQELDLVVGMTGDGVNDAPALKLADVGFAMGSGTEVSKEASDIIILDDNFLSISKAILFGRTIFKSIRKFIILQLTINFCAISLSIIGPFIGIDTPVTIIQMLWINMIMDTLAGLAFAFEPPLLEYMNELPKKKTESIINKYMIQSILFTGLYSTILCILFLKSNIIDSLFRADVNDIYKMTAFFGLFIFIDIFNCFNARTHRINILANIKQNKVFLFIISLIIIIQIMMIYYGGNIFRTKGLTLFEFQVMILFASSVIPVDLFRKYLMRKNNDYSGV